jgi:hypothetical protein
MELAVAIDHLHGKGIDSFLHAAILMAIRSLRDYGGRAKGSAATATTSASAGSARLLIWIGDFGG